MSRLVLLLATIAVVALYLRSPIDFVPDRLGALGLIDDLVVVVLGILWWRRRFAGLAPKRPADGGASAKAGPGQGRAEPFDPYRVLGVSRGATQEEIRRAYHEQLRSYHPDRVDGLGADLRELAHQRTLEIRRAYDALKA